MNKVTKFSGKVLVMDDEELIRDMAGHILKFLGLEVVTARDGSEALQLHNDALKIGYPFDLAILDIVIPGGMGGFETADRLIKIDPQIKVVASSGYCDEGMSTLFKSCEFDDVLPKPYSIDELKSMLSRVLTKSSASARHTPACLIKV